jgi:pantothenate kinase
MSLKCIQSTLNQKINKIDDVLYDKLNKKLDYLRNTKCKQTQKHNKNKTQTSHSFYTRIKNLSNITFNNEETTILELGLNYAFERTPKQFLQDLIIDTENAIKQLDNKEQGIYRFLAHKKIKQIQNTNTKNILYKRQQYVIKQIRTK